MVSLLKLDKKIVFELVVETNTRNKKSLGIWLKEMIRAYKEIKITTKGEVIFVQDKAKNMRIALFCKYFLMQYWAKRTMTVKVISIQALTKNIFKKRQ